MKTGITCGFILMLAASAALVHGEDNPSQAAARAALAAKLFDLDRETSRPPATWAGGAETARPAPAKPAVPPAQTNLNTMPAFTAATNPPPPTAPWSSPAMPRTNALPVAVAATIIASNPPPAAVSLPAAPPQTAPAPTPASAKVNAPAAPVKTRPSAPSGSYLETVNGTIYHNVVVERVETNAIVISYIPQKGGISMMRVYFDELAPDARERYETVQH
jgi:hypothetical protein